MSEAGISLVIGVKHVALAAASAISGLFLTIVATWKFIFSGKIKQLDEVRTEVKELNEIVIGHISGEEQRLKSMDQKIGELHNMTTSIMNHLISK